MFKKSKTSILVSDIFRSAGAPTITYVERDDGLLEKRLKRAVLTKGNICIVTGPSKTGKSTLYKRVLNELDLPALIVRSDGKLTIDEFWARALESVNFSQIQQTIKAKTNSTSLHAKIAAKLNWFWVADASGELGGEASEGKSEEEVRQRILSKPGPKHLVPILKELPLILVVEDFHYLRPQVRKTIFQQWKMFVDENVSAILVGTTHHADDLIKANPELSSRKTHIDVGMWSSADLQKIPKLGMAYLGVEIDQAVPISIANEAVGLPVIAQQASEQILFDKGYVEITPGKEEILIVRSEVALALHNLAREKYSEFEMAYKRIAKGPRQNARKYDTYKLVLSTFAEEPIRFALERDDLERRLKKLPDTIGGVKIEKPPAGSVNSMLKALNNHQKKIGREVMEWIEEDNTLYIIEPVFLFYLRWRVKRDSVQPLYKILLTALLHFAENGRE